MKTERTLGQVAHDAWHGSEPSTRSDYSELAPIAHKAWGACAEAVLAAHSSDYRTMRSLLLRIHSARVAMNEAAVIAALDGVDAFFREENTN